MNNKLYILCGIPFSGKSILAKEICKKLGFTRIDLDEVKFDIFNPHILDSQIDQAGWDKIYQEMYRKIRQCLINGETVINDTGNFTRSEREIVKKIANELGVETMVIFVSIPQEEAYKRLLDNRKTKARFDVADEDFYSTVAEMEIPDEAERHLIFDWQMPMDKWIEDNLLIK